MRIALVHPYSWPAVYRGGERILHNLAHWLAGRGHEVDVLTGAVADLPPLEVVGSVTFRRLPLWAPRRLRDQGLDELDMFGVPALRELSRHRYDVVHGLVPSTVLAAVATGQPSVFTAIGHPSPDNPIRHRLRRVLFDQAVRRSRVAAALSESAATGITALTGRRPQVLYPGVFLGEFKPNLEPRVGPPRLLFNSFAGDPRKRLATLLAAMPRVLDALPDARLTLGGGGDPTPALTLLPDSARRRVADAVDDLGVAAIDRVPDRYRAASITVLPSVHEAFGLVLAESLACGTPVVATTSGGMAEIVTNDVGRVVAPENPGALAAAIIDVVALAAEPAVPASCVERAQRWDWSVVGPPHELAYAKARG